ncbi:radical SAM/SPASM domain-containing protein [Bradyrhizobium sp. LHD-71]|uniref:radical SAM/SPASM domain-containing protein n=1 Tax=Bradyrhizobium sp. LHD-71 TaxID=3072141 RepID=UPI0028100FD8|nr:SPASM domain-containing protein [Bradyrhizobium sp. LHD-71]MDQ8731888.1 SPASM domain-containing protein [Bradyrhizobium sp. LHD-71]
MPDFECQVPQDHEQAEVASLAQNSARASALEVAARQTLSTVHGRQHGAAANSYKASRYDIPVRLADGAALLFNSRTRSLILLSDGEARIYRELAERPSFSSGDVSDRLLLEALVGGGHVVGATVDELAVVRNNYDATRSAKNNLTLTIAPTMACNFACGYCFQGLNKPTTKMKPDVQNAIVDFVKAKKDLKSLSIVWYGGEPLMGKDSIFRLSDILISYCDKQKIAYSAGIVSNAWFLNGEMAAQLYTRRIRWVQVTIDGDRGTHDKMRPLTSGHGTFDRILDNIAESLDQTAIAINVRVNVGQSNVDNVNSMLDRLVERNFAKRGNFSVYFAPIEASTPESGSAFEEKLSRAEFNRKVLALEERARRLGFASIQAPSNGFAGMCVAASHGGYVVSGEGDVHKCWETAHDPSKRTGSIFEPDKLHDSVNASLWSQWEPFDNPICASCKILPMCGGFCAHRFVYSNPEEAALPCPSWKWNTAEYVFSRAKGLGVVSADQWLPEEATVEAMQSGERHSLESLQAAQARVLEKVSALHGRRIDSAMLFAGEAALEAAPSSEAARADRVLESSEP